jgi:DNA-binding Lrp family transcriptional regulator
MPQFSKTQQKIFELLRKNPSISITELAQKLNRSRPTIYKEVELMTKENNLSLSAIAHPSALGYELGIVFTFNIQFHRGADSVDALLDYFRKNKHVAFFASGKGMADAIAVMFYENMDQYLQEERRFRIKFNRMLDNARYFFFNTQNIDVYKNFATKQRKLLEGKPKRGSLLMPEYFEEGENLDLELEGEINALQQHKIYDNRNSG